MKLNDLSRKTGVPSSDLLKALTFISNRKLKTSDVISATSLSRESIRKLRLAAPEFFLPVQNILALSKEGEEFINQSKDLEFKFTKAHEDEILRILESYRSLRPLPKREYDQFYATSDTQVRRVKIMSEQNILDESQIIFLGDDDLTSLCVGSLGLCKSIAVVDIDQRQLSFIEESAKKEGIKIELYLSDLRDFVPKELKKRFDIVFTDPPYSEQGFKLFLGRGIEVLKKEFGTIYACYGTSERSPERLLPIQQEMTDLGLAIMYAFNGFNKYEGAESIGNSSNLYTLKTTPRTELPTGRDLKRIYSYE